VEPVTIDREALGEILALVDDHDGCHARVREWEALEQWEKDAHPDEEPFTDREDAEWWNRRADAVIARLATSPPDALDVVKAAAWSEGWDRGNAFALETPTRSVNARWSNPYRNPCTPGEETT